MEITLIIVGGIVVTTLIAGIFDFAGKRKASVDPQVNKRMVELENRLDMLQVTLAEKDEKIERLSNEIGFVNRLLDQRSEKL